MYLFIGKLCYLHSTNLFLKSVLFALTGNKVTIMISAFGTPQASLYENRMRQIQHILFKKIGLNLLCKIWSSILCLDLLHISRAILTMPFPLSTFHIQYSFYINVSHRRLNVKTSLMELFTLFLLEWRNFNGYREENSLEL